MRELKPVQDKQSLLSCLIKQLMVFYVLMFPFLARAAKEPGLGILEEIIDVMQGGYARAIAIIAIAALGYSCFWAQKLEVRKAAYIAIAIILIFGAAEIADLFMDNAD